MSEPKIVMPSSFSRFAISKHATAKQKLQDISSVNDSSGNNGDLSANFSHDLDIWVRRAMGSNGFGG